MIRGARLVLVCVVLLGAAACTSGDNEAEPETVTTTTQPSPTTKPRPVGPAADMSRELTGGKGVYIGNADPVDLEEVGYAEREYLASGTATSYKAQGAQTRDGRWTFVPDATAPYKTRVLVRGPADPKVFSGTVILEWLNASGGVDADGGWATLHEEIVRRGDTWVGLSAQRIGAVGGPILVKVDVPGIEAAGKGLKAIDPARYGSLEHPGDGFSFDMYTQVARALRAGAGLGGVQPQWVIAAGQSQSAVALTTYFNGVEPLVRAFDGYLLHSRFAVALPLVAPGQYADLAGAIGEGKQTLLRTDNDVPVLDLQTETDIASILDSYSVRQPDSDRFRLWEVAGTAHADVHLIGKSNVPFVKCGVPINNGPMHLVAKAGLRALAEWIETGTAPVTAPRLNVPAGATPEMQRSADGIALGGIRTPPVDVPVAALSGEQGPVQSTICLLLGSAKPFSAARLAQLYPSRAEYLEQFEADADATIEAGFVLPEDRDALLAFAEPSRVGS